MLCKRHWNRELVFVWNYLVQVPGTPRTAVGDGVDVTHQAFADLLDDNVVNSPVRDRRVSQPSPPASQRYVAYDERPLPAMRKYENNSCVALLCIYMVFMRLHAATMQIYCLRANVPLVSVTRNSCINSSFWIISDECLSVMIQVLPSIVQYNICTVFLSNNADRSVCWFCIFFYLGHNRFSFQCHAGLNRTCWNRNSNCLVENR